MDRHPSTYRSDEQLYAMLDEMGDWIVNDTSGLILWRLASLRGAIRKAEEQTAAGGSVRAASRLSPSAIIVFADQIDRIVSLIDDRREAQTSGLRMTGDQTA